jgi:hypothetical protein
LPAISGQVFIKDRDLLYQEIAGKYWKISFASLLSPPFICIIISRMVLRCPLGVFHAPAQAREFDTFPNEKQRISRMNAYIFLSNLLFLYIGFFGFLRYNGIEVKKLKLLPYFTPKNACSPPRSYDSQGRSRRFLLTNSAARFTQY